MNLNSNLDVIVTCHADYLGMLRACLASIDRQAVAGERIVCLDGCDKPSWIRPAWKVIRGQWGNPNPARNAGLAAAKSDWVVHFDADNVMPPGFLQNYAGHVRVAGRSVAVLYPDIQYVKADMTPARLWKTPEFDRLELARGNYIDTSSCWRRDAVLAVGGWKSEHGLDDWTLAMALCRDGWTARKCPGQTVLMRQHALPRRSQVLTQDAAERTRHKWNTYTFGIVTLLAPGRPETHKRWLRWLRNAQLPSRVGLTVVDDREGEGNRLIHRAMDARDWSEFRVLESDRRCEGRDWLSIHRHVASLYRLAIGGLKSDLVLFLEDDIEPPGDAFPRLFESFGYEHCKVGACAACYLSRSAPGRDGQRVAVSYRADRWGEMPTPDAVPRNPHAAGMVPGGCTLCGSWALAKALPFSIGEASDGSLIGWDGNMCRQMRRNGFGITLDGRVWCKHYVPGGDDLPR